MQPEKTGKRLKDSILSHGVQVAVGVSEEQIAYFERQHDIKMPPDLRGYLVEMNGSADYAFGLIRFWSLDEMKSVAQAVSDTPPSAAVIQAAYRQGIDDAAHYFVFADFLHESQLYAIHLSSSLDHPNQIKLLDGTAPVKVADSFAEFADLYIASPESLRLCVD